MSNKCGGASLALGNTGHWLHRGGRSVCSSPASPTRTQQRGCTHADIAQGQGLPQKHLRALSLHARCTRYVQAGSARQDPGVEGLSVSGGFRCGLRGVCVGQSGCGQLSRGSGCRGLLRGSGCKGSETLQRGPGDGGWGSAGRGLGVRGLELGRGFWVWGAE